MTSETLRLFFAVEVPEEVKADLARACAKLPAAWRKVQPAQMHLTLVFMGEVPADDLDLVIAAGEQAASSRAPFRVTLGDTDCFPGRSSPRVLFVHAQSEGLVPLAGQLQKEVRDWADPKPFRAHLTLARRKLDGATFQALHFDHSWMVESFDLVRSRLAAGGAEHAIVRTFRLGSA